MNLVPTAISGKVARQGLLASRSAPSFLFATGVAGMVGTTILACRATLQMEDVIDEAKIDLERARNLKEGADEYMEHMETHTPPPVFDDIDFSKVKYSDEDLRNDTIKIYSRAVGKTIRLYAPALMLGGFSIGCLTKSHDILNRRNAALTAAYAAVDEAFTQYRRRVVNKYGEEQDREFRYGVQEVEIIDDNGKMHTEKQPDMPSMYARFFDEYSTSWSKQADYNYVFLSCQQKYANDMLKARGHLFLNEVYDMLGIPRTTAGSVVGWVIDDGSDNYVDFGCFKGRPPYDADPEWRDFINGRNNSVLLDFNVDGVIYDKLADHTNERLKWQS